MKKILTFLFFLVALSMQGQYDYSDRCILAHEYITALRFEEARELIAQEHERNPGNLVPVMLENYIDFLSILVAEDEAVFDSLAEYRTDRLDLLSEGDPGSPWYRSLLAKVNLQWAFARIKFGSYFTAGLEARRAYRLLEENAREYPGFLPDKVGLGILHALVGTIPDNYRWVAGLFSMHGSVEQGRKELMDVLLLADSLEYTYLKGEALFFRSFIDLNLQADREKALELLPYYDEAYQRNLLLTFSYARILMQNGMNDRAIDVLQQRPGSDQYFPFYYLDFLLGQSKLNRLDADADKYFYRFTTNFKGDSYIKSAYERLAWSSLLKGDTAGYRQNMQKVLVYGDDFTDGDKMALQAAESAYIPDKSLLRARLLFDGGYYHAADSILGRADKHWPSLRERIEYPYRRGRVFHAMGLHDEALEWYNKAIGLGSNEPWYYAANAALKAGMISELEGRYTEAEEYYHQCLRMKNKEYRTSIAQKAKAGLNRLEEIEDVH